MTRESEQLRNLAQVKWCAGGGVEESSSRWQPGRVDSCPRCWSWDVGSPAAACELQWHSARLQGRIDLRLLLLINPTTKDFFCIMSFLFYFFFLNSLFPWNIKDEDRLAEEKRDLTWKAAMFGRNFCNAFNVTLSPCLLSFVTAGKTRVVSHWAPFPLRSIAATQCHFVMPNMPSRRRRCSLPTSFVQQ